MANLILRILSSANTSGITQTNTALGRMSRTAGETRKALAGMATGLAGVGAAKFLSDSVGAASDLNETLSKSSVIFGDNAGAMREWSKNAASTVGLSQQAALDAAAGFGDMFSQLGIGGDTAAAMSKQVVQMAADFGSFNNLPTAQVADSISAAFRGEFDSLQSIVPNINAARVEQEALALSHKKTAKELTAAEKAQAVMNILQKDGTRAMGDFARTSDGFANSQKIMAARLEDSKAKLGQSLLPAMTAVTQFMTDTVIPAFTSLIDFLQRNGTAVKTLAGAILGLWAAWKAYRIITRTAQATLLLVRRLRQQYAMLTYNSRYIAIVNRLTRAWAVVQRVLNTVMRNNPIVRVITILVALAAVVVIAYKKSETFRRIVQAAWSAIQRVVQVAWGVIQKIVGALIGAWQAIMNKTTALFNWVRDAFNRLVSFLAGIPRTIAAKFGDMWRFFRDRWIALRTWIGTAVVNFLTWIANLPKWLAQRIGDLWKWFRDRWTALRAWIGTAVVNFLTWIANLPIWLAGRIGDLWKFFRERVSGVISWVKTAFFNYLSWWANLPIWLANRIGDVWKFLRDKTSTAVGAVKDFLGGIITWIGGLPGRLASAAGNLFGFLGTKAKEAAGAAVGWIGGIPEKLGKLAGTFLTAGGNLISKVVEGIKGALGSIGGAFADIGSSIVNAIKNALNDFLHLPLKIPEIRIGAFGKYVTVGGQTLIPRLATGAYLTQATLAVVGDGPANEFVAPEPMLRRIVREETMGRGGTINLTINVPATANPAETGRQVADVLRKYFAAGGRLQVPA